MAVGQQHTEEDVAQIIQEIRDATSLVKLSNEFISTRDAHWAERDAALFRVGELIQEGSLDSSMEDFTRSLRAVLVGLVAQLPDLRSQVVRSACNTLALLAAEVGDHAALDKPMRDQVLPAVISLISNGNKVLATAGRECLPTLIMYCHFDGMLKALAQNLSESRHASVRHTCCVCVLHALQYWPVPVISQVAMVLEKALVPSCTDAAVEVRAIARQCVVQYALAFPERQQSVESRLDEPTRKLVKQETLEAENEPSVERHVMTPAARRTTAKGSTALAAARPTSRPSSRPVSRAAAAMEAPDAVPMSRSEAGRGDVGGAAIGR